MQIVNIVASGDLNQRIDFSELTPLHDKLLYDPEKYHGCYIRLSACKATLYKIGKFIFTGLKSLESVQETWDEFYNTLTSVISVPSSTQPKVNTIVTRFKGLSRLSRPSNLDINIPHGSPATDVRYHTRSSAGIRSLRKRVKQKVIPIKQMNQS
jgi:TATA-box binding protein (TBP), component of TFIID and TFIIIB